MAKFLFVQCNLSWGGSEYLWFGAAKWLQSQGHEVRLRLANPKNEQGSRERYSSFPHVRWALHYPSTLLERIQTKLFGNQVWMKDLSEKFDGVIVFSQGNAHDGLALMESALPSGAKIVTISQAVRDNDWPDDSQADRIINVFSKAARYYFGSTNNLEFFERRLGYQVSNAAFVWNPYQVSYGVKPSWPGSSTMKLLSLARLWPLDKGQEPSYLSFGIKKMARTRLVSHFRRARGR